MVAWRMGGRVRAKQTGREGRLRRLVQGSDPSHDYVVVEWDNGSVGRHRTTQVEPIPPGERIRTAEDSP